MNHRGLFIAARATLGGHLALIRADRALARPGGGARA